MSSPITAVMTIHDPGPRVLRLLQGLLEAGPFAAVFVVDSGSTDGMPEQIAAAYPQVVVERLGENRGPCATRNRGLTLARTPFVLLVDDDVELGPDCVARLLADLEADSSRVAAAPRTFHAGGREVQYEGGMWHFAGLPHLLRLEGSASRDVDVLMAPCLLVRRDPVLAAGGFDETLFYLMEDVELTARLRLCGHRLRSVPAAEAWNLGGSAGLSFAGSAYPARRIRLHARNRWIVLLVLYRWTTLLLAWPGLLLMDLAWLAFALQRGHLGAFLAGRWDLWRALPATLARRRAFQGQRRRDDRLLFHAPPLSFTAAALSGGPNRLLPRILDGSLRVLGLTMRAILP